MNRLAARCTDWIACALVLLAGCGGGSDGSAPAEHPPPPGAPAPTPASGEGATIPALTTRIHVRSDGAHAVGCGTTSANAGATIQKGIDSCATAGCGVVVRHGLYQVAAPIVLRDGVSVYGSCLFDGETRTYRRIVNGPFDQPAIRAASIASATTFHGFVVRAGDAFTAGGASIAMAVTGSRGQPVDAVQPGADMLSRASRWFAPQRSPVVTGH